MNEKELRTQLVNMLIVRQAHMDFVDAVSDFPEAAINLKPPRCDYTFWHLVEHLRICQKDILDYMVAEAYTWPNFPDDLWPDKKAETDADGWRASIDQFLADRQAVVDVVMNSATDLFAPLLHSGDHRHTVVREINVLAAHNAYHTGELGVLRQVMGLWG